MLSVTLFYCYAERCQAECRLTNCRAAFVLPSLSTSSAAAVAAAVSKTFFIYFKSLPSSASKKKTFQLIKIYSLTIKRALQSDTCHKIVCALILFTPLR